MTKPSRIWKLAWSVLRPFMLICFFASAGLAQQSGVLERAAQYEPFIYEVGSRYDVDWRLLWTIGYLETKFRPGLRSPVGARGMMQFMPATARAYGLADPYDPWGSIEAAARYVRSLKARFERADLVLASYNAGDLTVEAYLTGRAIRLENGKVINPRGLRTNGVPPYRETMNYVAEGMRVMAALRERKANVKNLLAGVVSEEPVPRRGLIRASLYFVEGDLTAGERLEPSSTKFSVSGGQKIPAWLRPTAETSRAATEKARARDSGGSGAQEKPAREQSGAASRKSPTRSLYLVNNHEPSGD